MPTINWIHFRKYQTFFAYIWRFGHISIIRFWILTPFCVPKRFFFSKTKILLRLLKSLVFNTFRPFSDSLDQTWGNLLLFFWCFWLLVGDSSAELLILVRGLALMNRAFQSTFYLCNVFSIGLVLKQLFFSPQDCCCLLLVLKIGVDFF